jgi:putative ABC transport system permease protein
MEIQNCGAAMNYQFIRDSFDLMYRLDIWLGGVLICFTFLAFLICIPGLTGLAVVMTEQGIREMAVLKSYGVTISSVIAKLTKEFLLIAVITNASGCLFLQWAWNWPDESVYKTGIGAGIFIFGALLSTTIAMVTVISVTYRATTSNTANCIRDE